MYPRVVSPAAFLLTAGLAAQASFPLTITDGCSGGVSSYTQGLETAPDAPFAAISDFVGTQPIDCDGTVVFSHACFWRIATDPGLSQFYDSGMAGDQGGVTQSVAPTGDTWTVRWPDVANRGVLDASWTQTIECYGPRSALVDHVWRLRNTSTAPLTIDFVSYSDLDYGFAFENLTRIGSTPGRHIVEHDPAVPAACAGCVEFWGDRPTSYEIATWPVVEVKLTRPNFNGLADTGLPFGIGDYAGAMQWTATIQPGAVLAIEYSHGRNAQQCASQAAVANYGPADPGMTVGTATLPLIGASIDVDVAAGAGFASSSLLFGLQPLNVQIPGCTLTLLVDPVASLPLVLDANGDGRLAIPPVCDPQFCGMPVYMQNWVLGQSPACLPLRHSDGLSLTFGRP